MANDLDSAAKAVTDFASGTVATASRTIESTIDATFTAMERSIARAVTSGKTSIADFVSSAVASFNRLAVNQYISEPLESALSSIVSAITPVSGARAQGGPVEAGSSYLVGENGPELFVPSSSGSIAPNARPSIVMNVSARDAQSFSKSETQIAAMLSRALARGQRNL